MRMTTYLVFKDNCEEAFRFYEKVLNARIEFIMRFSESPVADQTVPEYQDKIMHICLKAGGDYLMGSDMPPQAPGDSHKNGFSIHLAVDSAEEAERIFEEFSNGGNVYMPLAETFWANRFGMVTDKFGVMWSVNFQKQCLDAMSS